jgi:hypothetical protein
VAWWVWRCSAGCGCDRCWHLGSTPPTPAHSTQAANLPCAQTPPPTPTHPPTLTENHPPPRKKEEQTTPPHTHAHSRDGLRRPQLEGQLQLALLGVRVHPPGTIQLLPLPLRQAPLELGRQVLALPVQRPGGKGTRGWVGGGCGGVGGGGEVSDGCEEGVRKAGAAAHTQRHTLWGCCTLCCTGPS